MALIDITWGSTAKLNTLSTRCFISSWSILTIAPAFIFGFRYTDVIQETIEASEGKIFGWFLDIVQILLKSFKDKVGAPLRQ